MSFQVACALNELEDDKPFAVLVGDVDVAIIRTEGEVFAIRDECSHAAVPLSEGDIDNCHVECWLHGSRFNLRTGQPDVLPATEAVPVYPVKVEGDAVLVDIDHPLNSAR